MNGIKEIVNELLREVFDNNNIRGDFKFRLAPSRSGETVTTGNRLGIVTKETRNSPAVGYFIQKGPRSLDFYLVDRGFMNTNAINMRVFAKFCKWENIEVGIIDRSGPAEVDVLVGTNGYPTIEEQRYGNIMNK